MNCLTARTHFNTLLDHGLMPAIEGQVMHHVAACPDCQQALARERGLRRLLREQPVPPPSPGFAARALRAASRRPAAGYRRGFGIAAAAAFALWIGTVTVPFGVGREAIPAVTLVPHETRAVRLVFETPRDLPDVTIAMRLPSSMEIAGYPGQRELTWQASLHAGANTLTLPLVARGAKGGELTAKIAYGSEEKVFRLKLEVQPTPQADRTPAVIGLV